MNLEKLSPGQILKIPPMAVETVVVQKGATLAQVAAARNTDVQVQVISRTHVLIRGFRHHYLRLNKPQLNTAIEI